MPVHVRMAIGTTPAQVRAAVLGLAAVSLAQMGEQRLPPLYGGTIRYEREPEGRERWQTAEETARLGRGDCEDLAAYRVAELHAQGIPATIRIRVVRPELWHVLVEHPNGQLEDPSAKLGMRGAA
jgi:transglutaminase-like putative cysteine protease